MTKMLANKLKRVIVKLYAISLNLGDKNCLVVGGGKVAERKALSLIEEGAKVRLVSPKLTDELHRFARDGIIEYRARNYEPQDLEDIFLVISATDNQKLNQSIAHTCFQQKILINVVDSPEISDFHLPAVLRQGDLCIAVSTGGKSPLLAKKIKEDLSNIFSSEYVELLDLLGELRKELMEKCSNQEQRKRILEELLSFDLLNMIKQGEQWKVKEWITRCISL